MFRNVFWIYYCFSFINKGRRLFFGHTVLFIPIHIALQLFFFFKVVILMCLFVSISFKGFVFQAICWYVFLLDHFFVKFVPNTNTFSYSFCNPGFRIRLRLGKKISNSGLHLWFFVAKFRFISFKSLLKKSMLKHLKSLYLVFICSP